MHACVYVCVGHFQSWLTEGEKSTLKVDHTFPCDMKGPSVYV